jgi:hypothetical protein
MCPEATRDNDDDDDHKPSKFSQVKPSPSTSSTEFSLPHVVNAKPVIVINHSISRIFQKFKMD